MTAADLATAGFIDEWMRALHAAIQAGQTGPAAAEPATVVLYSIQKLAQVLDVHPDTVRQWLNKGKKGPDGRLLKLQAYKFTSEPRIPWPAVLAYHRGEAFDLDALPAPLLVPELAVAAPPVLTPSPGPAPLLRVA